MRWLVKALLCLLLLACGGCDYEEVTKETGYKGKARINPWLAAERFVARKGYTVKSSASWKEPDGYDSVYFMPVQVLNNAGFISRMERWIASGGHLVLLVDYSDAEWNDWYESHKPAPSFEKPLEDFLEGAGLSLLPYTSEKLTEPSIKFGEESYEVEAESKSSVRVDDEKGDHIFASVEYDYGRISVVTDARIFRSRYIDQKDHAALLDALIQSSANQGQVVFLRGAGISLWNMLGRHLWPVLIGLGVLLLAWLWKSFSRFGPVESSAVASSLRGYDHHLEALGDFQWRLDRGSALLAPLRERIVENGQRAAAASGRRDVDFFQFLAERSGLARERVERALTEVQPQDGAVLTRTAGDLQKLLQVLR